MRAVEVFNVLFTEHPQWGKVPRRQLSITSRDGWDYVVFRGEEIFRVQVVGRYIFEELLTTKNPEDYR